MQRVIEKRTGREADRDDIEASRPKPVDDRLVHRQGARTIVPPHNDAARAKAPAQERPVAPGDRAEHRGCQVFANDAPNIVGAEDVRIQPRLVHDIDCTSPATSLRHGAGRATTDLLDTTGART